MILYLVPMPTEGGGKKLARVLGVSARRSEDGSSIHLHAGFIDTHPLSPFLLPSNDPARVGGA